MITETITKPITRKMTAADIPFLNLEYEWLRDFYYDFFDQGWGPSWVIEDDEGLIAAFGATICFPGVWDIWFSLMRKDKNLCIVRTVKGFFDRIKSSAVRRYHCTVKGDINKRFVEFFGFKCETPEGMKCYHPDGSTAWLYSRINDND